MKPHHKAIHGLAILSVVLALALLGTFLELQRYCRCGHHKPHQGREGGAYRHARPYEIESGDYRRLVYRNLDAKEHLTGLLPYAIIML